MAHKLLLADDSATIRRMIELTFASEDIQVITVSDGEQAIDRLDADPPDIVLADVGMPGRSGYDVAAYIRGRPGLAHIPVVLLAGALQPIDQVRALAVGSCEVLEKPFEPHVVVDRVKKLLQRPREETPAHEAADPASASLGAETPTLDGAGALDQYFNELNAAFVRLRGANSPATRAPLPPPGAGPEAAVAPLAPIAAAAVPEEMIQEIAARVLRHLSERVVRETATQMVSTIAERLVREEIERIKRGE